MNNSIIYDILDYLILAPKILIAIISAIVFIIMSIVATVKKKKKIKRFLFLIIPFMLYMMFGYGVVKTPKVTSDEIKAFKEQIEIENLVEGAAPQFYEYYYREKNWANITIEKMESFDETQEFKNAESNLYGIFRNEHDLLFFQQQVYEKKVKRGEIDGIKYIISPLISEWYGGSVYGGKLWFTYDTTVVTVEYRIISKWPWLFLITHPAPSEWDLLEFLD